MDYQEIERLILLYFEGETSLEEESILRSFFSKNEVPESLRPYQPLFWFFVREQAAELDESFDRKLFRQIAATPATAFSIRRIMPVLGKIAAVVILVFGIWWFYPPKTASSGIDWSKYEPKTPEEAYQITRKALLRVSTDLNRGATMAADEVSKVGELGRFFD